ncbi:MAG: single-stranded DNA-binding protein [Opitutaceae bacterium]
MAYLNKVFLIGNLTRDPELRVTPKGTAVCSLGLAVNRSYRDDSGATHEETTYVDLEAWGKQGELISKYLSKGSPAMFEGRLRFDSWESKTGEKRSKLRVVVDNVQFLGRGGGDSGGEGESQGFERHSPPARSAPTQAPVPPPADDEMDDDVPF